MPSELIVPTERGLWCQAGGFHIDPWRPVERAVVTHAHADHATPGCAAYIATPNTIALMRSRSRLGEPGHQPGSRLGEPGHVWDRSGSQPSLVPFAKAYSGLDQAEIEKLDRWIRAHTVAKRGPFRRVQPVQVFEIGFEGLGRSDRHKSGIAVRFPRILRWRADKPASEADTLDTLEALLRAHAG